MVADVTAKVCEWRAGPLQSGTRPCSWRVFGRTLTTATTARTRTSYIVVKEGVWGRDVQAFNDPRVVWEVRLGEVFWEVQ